MKQTLLILLLVVTAFPAAVAAQSPQVTVTPFPTFSFMDPTLSTEQLTPFPTATLSATVTAHPDDPTPALQNVLYSCSLSEMYSDVDRLLVILALSSLVDDARSLIARFDRIDASEMRIRLEELAVTTVEIQARWHVSEILCLELTTFYLSAMDYLTRAEWYLWARHWNPYSLTSERWRSLISELEPEADTVVEWIRDSLRTWATAP